MDKETLTILIYNRIKGEISPQEVALLNRAINEDPALKVLEEEILLTWRLTGIDNTELPEIDLERDWKGFQSKLSQTGPYTKKGFIRPIFVMTIAASVIILIGVSLFTMVQKNAIPKVAHTETDIKSLTLPDGSQVWLNAHSSIEYFANNRQKRHLKLVGEAYFDVVSNRQKPFVVESGPSTITVVGTAFNVSNNEEKKQTTVTVDEGKVVLASTSEQIEINPDQQATCEFSSGNVRLLDVASLNATSWKSGIYTYASVPLESILKNLSDIFDVTFDVKDQSIADCELSVVIKGHSIMPIAEKLAATVNATVEKVSDRHLILINGSCN